MRVYIDHSKHQVIETKTFHFYLKLPKDVDKI